MIVNTVLSNVNYRLRKLSFVATCAVKTLKMKKEREIYMAEQVIFACIYIFYHMYIRMI